MAARSGSARSSKPRKGSTPPLSALDLGIDLGTTRTVVARADRGNYPVLSFTDTNGDSHDYYPSLTALTDDGLVKQFETYNNGVVGFEYQSGNMDIALFANVLNHKIHQTDEFTFISNFIFSRSLSAVAYEGVQQPENPEPDNPDPKPDPKPGDSGTTDPKPTTPPETGDTSNVMLWVAVAVISCGMIPAAVVVLKRKAR